MSLLNLSRLLRPAAATVALAAVLMLPNAVHAQPAGGGEKPAAERSERPRAGERRQRGGQTGRYMEMLRAELAKLDLTEDQLTKIRDLGQNLRTDLTALREKHGDDRQALRQAGRERMSRFRGAIGEVLTEEQRAELRTAMEQLRREQGNQPRRARGAEAGERAGPERRGPRREGGFGRPSTRPSDATSSRFESRLQNRAESADLSTLPLDLPLLTATGNETTLGQNLHANRPTVVLLGSYSAPSFRERLRDLPWLVGELRTPGGRSADLLVVYTKERHPSDGWTHADNADAGVVIPQHADANARMEAARMVRERLPARTGVSLVLDTMDDSLLGRVADNDPGDHVLILKPDGTVAARQRWFDPTAIIDLVADAEEK
ncbi:MAG: deiodinase-like protein [Planctomycetota bacterium]